MSYDMLLPWTLNLQGVTGTIAVTTCNHVGQPQDERGLRRQVLIKGTQEDYAAHFT